jgi:hypothetical protein
MTKETGFGWREDSGAKVGECLENEGLMDTALTPQLLSAVLYVQVCEWKHCLT